METNLHKNQSRARRIRLLLKKRKGLIGTYQDTKDFEEPCLLLMRRSRKVEFYEKATQGKFIFEHSDGQERAIELNPQFIHTFDYGKRDFRGYVCHEDYPTPLPDIPVVSAEMYQLGIEKTLNDIKKWKAEEMKGIGEMWFKIRLGIAIVIGVLALAKMLVPSLKLPFFSSDTQTVTQVAQQIGENATIIARNITKLP